MSGAARAALRGPMGPAVIDTARRIIAGVDARDYRAQAHAICDWVAARFRFVRDPDGIELVPSVAKMLGAIKRDGFVQEDCDGAAVLVAALALAVGIRAHFVAVAFLDGSQFSHVLTRLMVGPNDFITADCTRPAQMLPPTPVRELRLAA